MDARTGAGAGNANLFTAVYKVNLNCHGCAERVERAVKACDGVEDCMVDCELNTVTVVFGKVDPVKIEQKLEKKTKKKVQLLSVRSGAPAVRGDDKEDKTEQKNEKKTEGKTKENTVQVPREQEVEMYVKIACCLKIKVKGDSAAVKREFAPFATSAKKQEGEGDEKETNKVSKVGGDKKESNSDSKRESGNSDKKRVYPRNPYPPMFSSESYEPYGGAPSFPAPQTFWRPYPSYPYPYPQPAHFEPSAPPEPWVQPEPSAPPVYYCRTHSPARDPIQNCLTM